MAEVRLQARPAQVQQAPPPAQDPQPVPASPPTSLPARPPVSAEAQVRAVANILRGGSRYHVKAIALLLSKWDITEEEVSAAYRLMGRGTAHTPNARLSRYGARNQGIVKTARGVEVFYRAAFIINTAVRIHERVKAGDTLRQAVASQERYRKQHEAARKARQEAAAQVQVAAEHYGYETEDGTLVGWYLDPFKNNDAECIAANGNNFYVEHGTVIGYPGAVHLNCGCYAGPVHTPGGMVNDALRGLSLIHRRPKLRLKKTRRKRIA